MSINILTKDFICEKFTYKDGELHWKLYSNKKGWYERKAGFITNEGIYKVKINKKFYAVHRLIYIMFYGVVPSHLSHTNKDKLDNRIENICPVIRHKKAPKLQKKCLKDPKRAFESTRQSFVYRWESEDGRFYIGKHKGYADDGYICGNFFLKKDIKTNQTNWKRTVLLVTDNEVDAYKVETLLIRANKLNDLCLNGKLV